MSQISQAAKDFYLNAIRNIDPPFNNFKGIIKIDDEIKYLSNHQISYAQYHTDHEFICDYVYANYLKENISGQIFEDNLKTLNQIYDKLFINPIAKKILLDEYNQDILMKDFLEAKNNTDPLFDDFKDTSKESLIYLFQIIKSLDGDTAKYNLIQTKSSEWVGAAQNILDSGFSDDMLLLQKSELANLLIIEIFTLITYYHASLKYVTKF